MKVRTSLFMIFVVIDVAVAAVLYIYVGQRDFAIPGVVIYLSVGLLADCTTSYRRIWLKFSGRTRLGPIQRRLDFGGDPDQHLDPG